MEKYQPEYMELLFQRIEAQLGEDSGIFQLFRNCYRNTLDTTIRILPDETAYVITGDIPAMWLRDSAAQMRPYLIQAKGDEKLRETIAGLVKRQFWYLNIDCYANAFNETPSGACWAKDDTEENPWVWERKFEVDSLCYPIQLAWLLWKNTGCTSQFDKEFKEGAEKIITVMEQEQYHEERSSYRFSRKNTYFQDTLSREGKGALVKSGTGMIWSGFRPSDDACVYGYHIPDNMFAAVALGYLEEICCKVLGNDILEKKAAALKAEIRRGIEAYGVTEREGFGRVYAYEADGFGQYLLMDDANVPSLLSMEYLGYVPKSQETAENTRRFILSEGNPYYFKGKKGAGIGSLHTPPGYIWHIAMAMEGLTAKTKEEKKKVLKQMAATDGGTGMMHEGFLAEDDKTFTRPWFSWANSLFCELVLDYCGFQIEFLH